MRIPTPTRVWVALIAGLLVGHLFGHARAETAAPAPPEYSRGWCDGWNGAVALLQQRYENLRAVLSVGRTPDAEKAEAGRAVGVVVGAVNMYLMLQPSFGEIRLPNGLVVTCTPPPEVPPPAPPPQQ